MSLKKILLIGLLLGVGFSTWNWISTLLNPLAEDTLGALAIFYGPMFTLWGIAGFVAAHRTGRLRDGVKVAAAIAFVTFVVFDLAVIGRVNFYLDALVERSDWQNMMARFPASGFKSLMAYINYNYVTGAPFKILVATIIGAITGLVGGAFGSLIRRSMGRLPQS